MRCVQGGVTLPARESEVSSQSLSPGLSKLQSSKQGRHWLRVPTRKQRKGRPTRVCPGVRSRRITTERPALAAGLCSQKKENGKSKSLSPGLSKLPSSKRGRVWLRVPTRKCGAIGTIYRRLFLCPVGLCYTIPTNSLGGNEDAVDRSDNPYQYRRC